MRENSAELVVISPQLPEHSVKLIQRHKLDYKILHDNRLTVSDSFGLTYELPNELTSVYAQFGINVPDSNGTDSWKVPMPARYIVSSTGEVRYADINADYTVRPEPEETLDKVRQL